MAQLSFIGCNASVPSRYSTTSGYALSTGFYTVLFDVPEGTQYVLMNMGIALDQVGAIFISHMHLDHCAGLISLLQTLCVIAGDQRKYVFGPPGLRYFIESNFMMTHATLTSNIEIIEYGEKESQSLLEKRYKQIQEYLNKIAPQKYVYARFNFTDAPVRLYSAEERPAPDPTEPESGASTEFPGLFTVTLGDGARVTIFPLHHVVPSYGFYIRIRTHGLMITTDTNLRLDASFLAETFGGRVDVFVTECTFDDAHAGKAEEYGHSCPAYIRQALDALKCSKLVISHFGRGYGTVSEPPARRELVFGKATRFPGGTEVSWGSECLSCAAHPLCYITLF